MVWVLLLQIQGGQLRHGMSHSSTNTRGAAKARYGFFFYKYKGVAKTWYGIFFYKYKGAAKTWYGFFFYKYKGDS